MIVAIRALIRIYEIRRMNKKYRPITFYNRLKIRVNRYRNGMKQCGKRLYINS